MKSQSASLLNQNDIRKAKLARNSMKRDLSKPASKETSKESSKESSRDQSRERSKDRSKDSLSKSENKSCISLHSPVISVGNVSRSGKHSIGRGSINTSEKEKDHEKEKDNENENDEHLSETSGEPKRRNSISIVFVKKK